MKRKPWRLGMMLVLVSIAAIAAFGPLGGPVADASRGVVFDVQVGSPATLTARDAAVNVPVNALCSGTRSAWVQVQVTERVGRRIAQGSSGQQITCTGTIQALTITVPATANSFKKGTAAVIAQIGFCQFCDVGATATAEVPVVNARK
jgi:hypothetical protein